VPLASHWEAGALIFSGMPPGMWCQYTGGELQIGGVSTASVEKKHTNKKIKKATTIKTHQQQKKQKQPEQNKHKLFGLVFLRIVEICQKKHIF